MCVTLNYFGRRIENMDEAGRILGEANVILEAGVSMDSAKGKFCLCSVDVRATAEMLACTAAQDEDDPMEYHLVRN